MLMLGLLALSFGLRHGFDADHIVAIDNITRKFQAEEKNSLSTGLFFALGHSTIVFLLTLMIVCGLKHFHHTEKTLQVYGGVIGASISAVFLWLTAAMNINALIILLKNKQHQHTLPRSILSFIGKTFFQKIDKPSKMVGVGFLFGLGFDTATEVGLLSIAASSTLKGFNLSLILLLPILFASGMILTDSLDSMFMSSLYRLTAKNKNKLRRVNIAIITFTTTLAFGIGLLELIRMCGNQWHWKSIAITLSQWVDTRSEYIGAAIVFILTASWLFTLRRLSHASHSTRN